MRPSEASAPVFSSVGPAILRRCARWRQASHETDFLPAALEIIERPVSPMGHGVSILLCSLVSVAVLWACLGKVDIIAAAPGSIKPVGNSKVVQPFETSVVREILVADGDHVHAGDRLVELDATTARADRDRFRVDLAKTQLEIARLSGLREFIAGRPAELVSPPNSLPDAEIQAARASLRAEASEQRAKLAGLDQQIVAKQEDAEAAAAGIAKSQASLPLVSDEAEVRRAAKEIQFGNKIAWLEAQERLVEQQHDLVTLAHQRESSLASEASLRRQREQTEAEFERNILGGLADAMQKAADIQKDYEKAEERVALQTLSAPIDGVVQQLSVHTVGGVVTPAEALMVVVPDGAGLIVEAQISNQDVGFVRPGQEAEIKIEAFNFTRYGLVHGTVLDVSRDAVPISPDRSKISGSDEADSDHQDQDLRGTTAGYIAHVALGNTTMLTESGAVELGPGMNVTAEIKTGQRRLISYLLSPIQRYKQESFRER